MDLVVVFLTHLRVYIIVPEKYIYGLDYKQLKNVGKNSCRDFLVYWSDTCVEGEHYPEPNSNAQVSQTFPAGNGAWFHGRTIYYTNSIEEARQIKERRRRLLPPVYNPARLSERPFPPLVLPQRNQESDTESEQQVQGQLNVSTEDTAMVMARSVEISPVENASASLVFGAVSENIESISESVENTLASPVFFAVNENMESSENTSAENALALQVLPVINDDLTVVNNELIENAPASQVSIALNNNIESSSPCNENAPVLKEKTGILLLVQSSVQNESIKQEPVFEQLNDDDLQAVAGLFDSSYEQCNDSDDDVLINKGDTIPRPKCDKSSYEFKVNDIVSGNIPFAKNQMGDRAYIVSQGLDFKQINLTQYVVKGLIAFNSLGFRDVIAYDVKFIKVLMVACIGLHNMKTSNLDPFAMKFIKDLFNIRCKGTRMGEFDLLKQKCISEICDGNY